VDSEDDLRRRFRVKSLPEFIDLFLNVIQNSFREEGDIGLLFDDARTYLKQNNVVYAEVHFAPSAFLRIGHRFDRLMSVLEEGAAALERDGLVVRFLIDVSRTFGVDNAMQNLALTLDHRIPAVIGIGLGGQEAGGPARDFAAVFERARSAGLRVVAHAGEAVGPESVRDAVEILGAERIGHGVSAVKDPAVMDLLDRRRVPLETCPTSNLFTGHYVKTLREHPIRPFFERGLRVTVNTDDPAIFGVGLVDEYANLVSEGIFDTAQTLLLLKNGIYATFLPPDEQDRMWAAARRAIERQGEIPPS
jgi:adenosine deaminase